MKLQLTKLALILGTPVALFAFQNCAKLGTNGIAVNDKVLSLSSEQPVGDQAPPAAVVPSEPAISGPAEIRPPSMPGSPSQPSLPSQPSQPSHLALPSHSSGAVATHPSCDDDDSKNIARDDDDDKDKHKHQGEGEDDDDDKYKDKDVEIVEAVKACEDEKRLSAPATNLDLNITQSVIKLDAYKVAAISGKQGKYVLIRAADDHGTVGPVNIDQTTLILCGFKSVESIKGVQNKVIVVGASIGEIDGAQNQFLLVNSSVNKVNGTQSNIKYYTLK